MPTFVYMTNCDGCGYCVDICPSDIMHIDPQQEPEPIAAQADQQRPQVPKLRHGGRGPRCGCRIGEHQQGGGDDVEEEAVHHQQMADPAPRVAELAGSQTRDDDGFSGGRNEFPATDAARRSGSDDLPMLKEVLSASLVDHVDERAEEDQHDHRYHKDLHRNRRYGCGKRSEWIELEHWRTPKRASVFSALRVENPHPDSPGPQSGKNSIPGRCG